MFVDNVIPTLLAWRREGLAGALVTLVGVEGTSPRPVGAQMAVNSRGDFAGQISAGCAESAIVAEAVSHIESGRASSIRYGRGSKYVDIRLPCGSGIDVFFDAVVSDATLDALNRFVSGRIPGRLRFTLDAIVHDVEPVPAVTFANAYGRMASDGLFERYYFPDVRLIVAGKGPVVVSTSRIAAELGWEVHVVSPELETLQAVGEIASQANHLRLPREFDTAIIDAWSAVVLLFHDHEWEPAILAKTLACNPFYVGALGSRRTHSERVACLREMHCKEERIAFIKGPVGLDINGANPPEIALSIVAEIVRAQRANSSQSNA